MTSLPRFSVAGKDISNLILSSLADNILGEMAPFLEATELRRNQILCQPGCKLRRVHFIQSGLVVFAKMMQDGRSTMIGSAGFEGMTMPNILSGMVRTDIECCVYIDGMSLSMSVDVLERLSTKHLALSSILKRYGLLMNEHIAQLSGCNRLHPLEQRCARLLLTIHDNANEQQFPLTQEALAMMLGAQRPHVSAVAAHFQQLGLIRYRHGQVMIIDPDGLKNVSCECYGFIEAHVEATFDVPNGRG